MFGRDLQKWQQSTTEEAIDPELPIFDPHFHLMDPFKEKRGLASKAASISSKLPGRKLKELFFTTVYPKPIVSTFTKYNYMVSIYEINDLLLDHGAHNVVKGLCVESGWSDASDFGGQAQFENVPMSARCQERSEWLKSNDKNFELGVIGFIDLGLGYDKVIEGIEKHLEVNPNVRGFRHQMVYHESKTIFSGMHSKKDAHMEEDFKQGLKALQEKNMVLDVWIHFTQLRTLVEMANNFPELTIVADHIGGVLGVGIYDSDEQREKVLEEWKENLEHASKCPNIMLKVSGMLLPSTGIAQFYKNKIGPTSDEVVEVILPFVQHSIQVFGEDRCMFASNFPVDKVNANFVVLYNAFKKCCDQMEVSVPQRNKLFHDNASKIYRF